MELFDDGLGHLPSYLSVKNIINLSNGVLGISVLTMPYCFQAVSSYEYHFFQPTKRFCFCHSAESSWQHWHWYWVAWWPRTLADFSSMWPNPKGQPIWSSWPFTCMDLLAKFSTNYREYLSLHWSLSFVSALLYLIGWFCCSLAPWSHTARRSTFLYQVW